MNKPHFFCNHDTINYLLDMDFLDEYPDIDFFMDVIDLPLLFTYTSKFQSRIVKTYLRQNPYSCSNCGSETASITVNKKSGKGKAKGSAALSENMPSFFQACYHLNKFIQANHLETLYADLDPDEAGIMLSVGKDNQLTYRVVSGRKRPDLLCSNFWSTPEMGRPYLDEFFNSTMLDTLPFDSLLDIAMDGNLDAMERVAIAYLNGDGNVEEDPAQAVHWFTKLAEADDATAQFNLALHYAKGHGIDKDFEKALYWFEKAADNGDEDALDMVKRMKKAIEAEPLATKGNAQAQADLAEVYTFLGNSLEQAGNAQDYAIALDLAQKSTAQNNGDGIWILALAYEHGRGVEEDINIAVELYKRGAELGHAPSQNSLACNYFNGIVVEENLEKGFELFLKSAEQGYGLAMKSVGYCYQFAQGVTGNMKKALEWYEKALEVIDDPELEQKVEAFRTLAEVDEHWGEDYTDVPEDF